MEPTPANLQAMFTLYSTAFQDAYESFAPWSSSVATEMPSKTKQNTYAWLARLPRLREWLGERLVHSLSTHDYTVVNRKFEDTYGIPTTAIDDDEYGLYSPAMAMLGEQSKKWQDDLVVDALANGESRLCYDGQYFFDTDHPVDMKRPALGVQQNYWSSGMALTLANYGTVRSTMMRYKGEDGRPIGAPPNILMVPPELEVAAKAIVNPTTGLGTLGGMTMVGSVENPYAGTADVFVNPELTDTTAWYLLATKKIIKPIIIQVRKPPVLVAKTSLTDENVFNHDEFIFGVDARGNAGYGLWFQAAKARA